MAGRRGRGARGGGDPRRGGGPGAPGALPLARLPARQAGGRVSDGVPMTDRPVLAGEVPADLVTVAERHGQVVAAGDSAATLADFPAGRTGQLSGSARLPARPVPSPPALLEGVPGDLLPHYNP